MTNRRLAAKRANTWLVYVAVTAVFVGVAAGALFLRTFLVAKASTCHDMALNAREASAQEVEHYDLVIGIAGNSQDIAEEARAFVASELASGTPTPQKVVRITLVAGDRVAKPSGPDGACFATDILVSPALADMNSYAKANASSRNDIAESLRKQYSAQVDRIARATATAILNTSRPISGDSGAFDVWPFVGDVPAAHRLALLDSFAVGGNNCLSIANPGALGTDGLTLISSRVGRCVRAGELAKARGSSVHLVPVEAIPLTGAQQAAQETVIAGLCFGATTRGCVEGVQ